MAGIYVHIPFCGQRCIYCDFFSTVGLQHLAGDYVNALLVEARLRVAELGKDAVRTLYVGGGTPSTLSAEHWQRLIAGLRERFMLSELDEFTVEVNPDDVTQAYMENLHRLGVNRVSMGVQSLVDEELRTINRRHTASQAMDAVRYIHEAGIDNVSIDLIYGLPGQTLSSWRRSVEGALRLGVQHISAYNLSYEPGTRLWHLRESGAVHEADDDLCVDMYHTLVQMLGSANFEHYEISNFALPGYYSRHNSAYWDGTPYLGLGASAHSYDGAVRRYNPGDLHGYIRSLLSGQSVAVAEPSQWWERYDEMVMVRLRTARGLDVQAVAEKFGEKASRHLMREARRHVQGGLLRQAGNHLVLTASGVMMSDSVIRDLMWDGQ